ncbi:hypothetical protein [Deinococcus radiotolerans]|uniref:Uncharacterized protein n=1 Tax=Deinococcus radiotolerans TaxID=1309407 RepID=A0ABQ2FNK0_9DEIO|nr:hypothetical protein [Deinococcus radiotolerans]GGL11624.1 hypothetical protein GCM10010844_32810 [Deinococcus radiotolerans]
MNTRASLTLLLSTVTLAPAASFSLGGELRNPTQAAPLGAGPLTVLLTNLSGGWLLGMGPLKGARFNVVVPATFKPPVQPLDVCDGVTVQPGGARTYTAETLLLFNAGTNAVATLVQADHPTTPTRRGQWVYSDRTVTLRGRCAGLNTYYSLTLRPGWTGVTTESRDGHFEIMNARSNLPYWVQPVLSRQARATFPTLFSGQRSAFTTR